MYGQNARLRYASLILMLVALLGCSGPVSLSYRVISSDQLPDQLADWRQLPADQSDVRDAVVGQYTYMRIAVGPCPSKELKVKKVLAGGPRLTVTTKMPRSQGEQHYPVLYLKLNWEARTKFGPEFLTLQINGWSQTFFASPRDRPVSNPDEFRPTATYEPAHAFRCMTDQASS